MIQRSEVEHVAVLAKLELAEAEIDLYTEQLNNILEYIKVLDNVDTEQVEPLAQVLYQENVLREDIPVDSLKRENVLAQAPERAENFFKAPKILGSVQEV